MIFSSGFAVLQAPVLDDLSFDPFPFQLDVLAAPKVYICGRENIQALVITLVIVLLWATESAISGRESSGSFCSSWSPNEKHRPLKAVFFK